MLRNVLFILTLVSAAQALASGDAEGPCPGDMTFGDMALIKQAAIETFSDLEMRNGIHLRSFLLANRKRSQTGIVKSHANSLNDLKETLGAVGDAKLEVLMNIWAQKIHSERGRFPGYQGLKGEPMDWNSLRRAFEKDSHQIHNVYTNYLQNLHILITHFIYNETYSPKWTNLMTATFPTMPYHLIFHEWVGRWLEKTPDAKNLEPALSEFHDHLTNRINAVIGISMGM